MKQTNRTVCLCTLALCALLARVHGDSYLHSPRGSNDRNCERNVNRNNGNRLFDSQNNAKGGYACPRAVGGPNAPASPTETSETNQKMYYYVGEKLPIEWTNQHGAGDNKNLQSEIVLQYACSDTLDPENVFMAQPNDIVGTPRDGIPRDGNDAATNTIPNNAADGVPDGVERRRFGMHETHAYYKLCETTERNKGLFTADQKIKRNDARGTRQNPNGNRNGLECPEERDYYPYWRPNPWRDIAVVTSDYSVKKRDYYVRESQATPATGKKGVCSPGTSVQAQTDHKKLTDQRKWHNNKGACEENGLHTWELVQYHPKFKGNQSPPPLVVQGDYSRVNQLGNGALMHSTKAAGMKEVCTEGTTLTTNTATCTPATSSTNTFIDNDGYLYDANFGGNLQANFFPWTVPNTPNKNCVLRLRYNISTYDYSAWENGNRYFDTGDDWTGKVGLTASSNCRGGKRKDGTTCTKHLFPAMTQDPYVEVGEKKQLLSLALNTNQHSRTFQDRSYVFEIKTRDAKHVGKRIIALGVRGKRGNIVQTYPAVEYDFAPNNLIVNDGDFVHAQWVGSDYNPQRGCNNGEGGPPDCQGCLPFSAQQENAGNKNSRADRTNIVFTDTVGYNRPAFAATTNTPDLLKSKILSDASVADTPFTKAEVWKLAYIGQDDDGSPLKTAGKECKTQDELNQIKNKNRRENHPQNCAKLNAAVTPYYDGGLMEAKLPPAATKGKRYSAMSTRNNNFSNRDQRLNICVKKTDADNTCEPEGSGKLAKWKRIAKAAPKASPDEEVDANAAILSAETVAPIEKDNDAIGDGEEEACEQRILDFLLSLGLGGLIAIAFAMLAIGAISAVLVQRVYARFQRGAVKNKNNWMDERPGAKV